MIGAATIGVGFYTVMWAQTQEENMENETYDFASSSAAPLFPNKSIDA